MMISHLETYQKLGDAVFESMVGKYTLHFHGVIFLEI